LKFHQNLIITPSFIGPSSHTSTALFHQPTSSTTMIYCIDLHPPEQKNIVPETQIDTPVSETDHYTSQHPEYHPVKTSQRESVCKNIFSI